MFSFKQKPMKIPTAAEALPGRSTPMPTASTHWVNGNAIKPPFPAGMETAIFGLGCFWGAERKFWQLPGVYATAVGYAGGPTPNPTYQEVCSGMTGHNEVVLVVFDPKKVSYEALLKTFWESHDPTQGMRQGNDVGTQYRSGIYVTSPAQRRAAEELRKAVPEGPCQGRLRRDYDRDRRRSAVLLRRGLSPAVFGKESKWLLRPRRHRRELPDRRDAGSVTPERDRGHLSACLPGQILASSRT